MYSINLSGTAYEREKRKSRIRTHEDSLAQITTKPAATTNDTEKGDRDASVLSDDGASACDSLSLSGDSVMSLSMNKPRPVNPMSRPNALRPISVFFHTPTIRFGKQDVGSVTVMKLPLCNPLAEPQLVMIEVSKRNQYR